MRVNPMPAQSSVEPDDCGAFFAALSGLANILAIKLYRLRFQDMPAVPMLPCLDHEAMLHEGIAPHAAAYVLDASGSLHEIIYIPRQRRIEVDVVSTMGECTPDAHERFMSALAERYPGHGIGATRMSWIRGDRRVAQACRAQVTLRDVLTGPDLDVTKAAVDRLQTISSLMEKESRVASWGSRTVMTPFVAVAGFLTYQLLGTLGPRLGVMWIGVIRASVVGILGGVFLYYGLKAVHLTGMANRVWKRSAEYGLILSERRRIRRGIA